MVASSLKPLPLCALLLALVASTAMASDHRARFCGFGGDRELLAGLQARWPTLEYCRAYADGDLADMKLLAGMAKELGLVYSLQSVAPAFPPGYLDEHQCWAVDFLGRTPPELGFSHPVADYCHPATVSALKRNLDVALGEVGAASFTMVDYVWPYIGGRWGYSDADFAAYRSALRADDGGLTISDADGARTISFWDYFHELSGLRFSPRDVGCESWNEYVPARPNEVGPDATPEERRSLFLFYGLYHYCWLRYAQECGEYAQSLGGELQASLNPENFGNGTDILTWGRLRGTGEPWLEEWGSAWIAIAAYHNLWYFARPYREAGKRLGLIGETGAAGGHPDSGFGPARPHYWDAKANYAVTYALGAAGQFNDREEDYIWAPLREMQDPGGPYADLWDGYVKAMDGFLQYAEDQATRPPCDVLCISTRSILYHADSSDYSTSQAYSLSGPLVDLHYDYHQGYAPLPRRVLDEHRVVLFSPWEYPAYAADDLREWLAGSPDRVLVTHSFAPTRVCRGLNQDAVPELDDASAAGGFGLRGLRQTDVREGEISFIAPEWQGRFVLPLGAAVSLPLPLIACEGRALVKLGDAALVTEVRLPDAGRAVYLNFAPPERYQGPDDPHSALLRACLSALLSEAGQSPQVEGSPHWACAKFDVPDGHVYALMDSRAARQARFTEETASMEPAEKLWLLLEPGTEYALQDMLTGARWSRRTDDQGKLEVYTSGKNVRLLSVARAPA